MGIEMDIEGKRHECEEDAAGRGRALIRLAGSTRLITVVGWPEGEPKITAFASKGWWSMIGKRESGHELRIGSRATD